MLLRSGTAGQKKNAEPRVFHHGSTQAAGFYSHFHHQNILKRSKHKILKDCWVTLTPPPPTRFMEIPSNQLYVVLQSSVTPGCTHARDRSAAGGYSCMKDYPLQKFSCYSKCKQKTQNSIMIRSPARIYVVFYTLAVFAINH